MRVYKRSTKTQSAHVCVYDACTCVRAHVRCALLQCVLCGSLMWVTAVLRDLQNAPLWQQNRTQSPPPYPLPHPTNPSSWAQTFTYLPVIALLRGSLLCFASLNARTHSRAHSHNLTQVRSLMPCDPPARTSCAYIHFTLAHTFTPCLMRMATTQLSFHGATLTDPAKTLKDYGVRAGATLYAGSPPDDPERARLVSAMAEMSANPYVCRSSPTTASVFVVVVFSFSSAQRLFLCSFSFLLSSILHSVWSRS